MTTRSFPTPGPITLHLEIGVGNITVTAGERDDAVVDVRPSNPATPADVAAAEQVQVEFADDTLQVRASRRQLARFGTWRGARHSVDVSIEVPAGSHLSGTAGVARLQCDGPFGACSYSVGAGDVRVEQAGEPVELVTGIGDVTVGRVLGRLVVRTGSGAVRIGGAGGSAEVKNANGDTFIGDVAGDVRVRAANGSIELGLAGGGVAVKSANGDIRVGEVSHGAVEAETACGRVDIGVRDGVAAWLDVRTGFGTVRSDLDPVDEPSPGEGSLEVRVRTGYGDVDIRRCVGAVFGEAGA